MRRRQGMNDADMTTRSGGQIMAKGRVGGRLREHLCALVDDALAEQAKQPHQCITLPDVHDELPITNRLEDFAKHLDILAHVGATHEQPRVALVHKHGADELMADIRANNGSRVLLTLNDERDTFWRLHFDIDASISSPTAALEDAIAQAVKENAYIQLESTTILDDFGGVDLGM
jgi:hypothetical protein